VVCCILCKVLGTCVVQLVCSLLQLEVSPVLLVLQPDS
jgi:hypothetical protein